MQNELKNKVTLLKEIFPFHMEFIDLANNDYLQISFKQIQSYLAQPDDLTSGQLEYINLIVGKLIAILGTNKDIITVDYVDSKLRVVISRISKYSRSLKFSTANKDIGIWITKYFTLLEIIDAQKSNRSKYTPSDIAYGGYMANNIRWFTKQQYLDSINTGLLLRIKKL